MKLRNYGLSIIAAAVLAACTAPADEQTQTTTAQAPATMEAPEFATVKPGAAVAFSHRLPSLIKVGDWVDAELIVREAYRQGTLRVEIRADEGLQVAPASALMRVDMAGRSTHSWPVRFQATADGVYYLHVFAEVEDAGEISNRRSYAIRVPVGDVTVNQKPAAKMGETDTGQTVVIMEAEETIEERN